MYPIRCESSTASCIPALLLKEQRGLHIIFQGEHAYSCHAELFTNYARNTTYSPPWVFPFERFCVCVCVTAFITPGTRVGVSDRKHWLIQVSGVWVKEGSPVCLCTSAHRCCQRSRQHVDSSAGPFPSDLSTHERKYDLQMTSKKKVCGGESALRDVALRDTVYAL